MIFIRQNYLTTPLFFYIIIKVIENYRAAVKKGGVKRLKGGS